MSTWIRPGYCTVYFPYILIFILVSTRRTDAKFPKYIRNVSHKFRLWSHALTVVLSSALTCINSFVLWWWLSTDILTFWRLDYDLDYADYLGLDRVRVVSGLSEGEAVGQLSVLTLICICKDLSELDLAMTDVCEPLKLALSIGTEPNCCFFCTKSLTQKTSFKTMYGLKRWQ
jgi:hypothetical protein